MDAVAFLAFEFPGLPGVGCAFTMRRGGASRGEFACGNVSFDVGDDPRAVAANRAGLQNELGFEVWRECRQVHGDAMVFDPLPGEVEADAMACDVAGRALVVKTADCQPVLLAHASGRYVAALHVGWRGNRLDLPGSGVRRFCGHFGLDPADVLAVRGPSLGPQHSEFTGFETEFGPDFGPWFHAKRRTLDLWALTRHQLEQAGLKPANIHGLDLCTRSLADDFFSYRRDRLTGRQAGIIWIRS